MLGLLAANAAAVAGAVGCAWLLGNPLALSMPRRKRADPTMHASPPRRLDGRSPRAERARLLHLQTLCQDHLSPTLAIGRRTRMSETRCRNGEAVFPVR